MTTLPARNWTGCGCVVLLVVMLLVYGRLILSLTGLPNHYGLQTFTAQAMMNAADRGDLGAVKRIVSRHPEMANCTSYGVKGEPYTALGNAIDRGHTAVALFLIDRGASPTAKSSHSTPLNIAVAKADAAVVKSLVAHAVSLEPPPHGPSPLMVAVYRNDWKMCSLLRSLGAKDVPLAFEAAARGDAPLLRQEIEKDPAMLHAKGSGTDNIVQLAVRFGRADSIRTLAALGADLNSPPPTSNSADEPPIAIACEAGNLEVVKALVAGGAHLEWPGVETDEENGLYYAVLGSHPNVVRYLLGKGLNPNATRAAITHFLAVGSDEDARANMEIARMLVSKGFIPDKASLRIHVDPATTARLSPVESYLSKCAR